MSTTSAASAVRARSRLVHSEWIWFGLTSLAVAGVYLLLRAPVFDPGTYLDPWIYTALMVNFKYLYHTFYSSYYTSRLPWLIPGIVAHSLFGPEVAFFVLHGIFFFSAGLFAYLTIRRFFGSTVALGTYIILMVSPLFYEAYATDYPDGALLTFLLGGVYFGVTAERSRRPLLRAAASGFFLAAAAGTNLFACIVIVFLLGIYGAVRVQGRSQLRAVGREVAAAACGVVLLLVACGSFAKANGGEFLFFMPSVRATQAINSADYKAAGYAWLLREPQLLLPIFLVVAVAIAYAWRGRGWLDDAGRRFAVGSAVSLGGLYALIVVWEFAFTGDFLETSYYFSLFNVGMILCIGALLGALWARVPHTGRSAALFVGVVAASALAPLVLLAGSVAPSGREAATIGLILMIVVLALLLGLRRVQLGRVAGVAVLVATVSFAFAAAYAAAGGATTQAIFARGQYQERRSVQRVALQLIDFMRAHGLQSDAPGFWYNPGEDPNLNGIQSTYLWGTTYAGLDMPRIDSSMRRTLEQRQPPHLVLLCKNAGCSGGPAALRKAGYKPHLVAAGTLASGTERVFVRAFVIPRFALAAAQRNDPILSYYVPGQSPFAVDAAGQALQSWSFARGAPAGWAGAAADASRSAAGSAFDTSSQQWDYEIESPKIRLAPGTYVVDLHGRVLKGGLDLGVLDADAKNWLVQSLYWFKQRGFGDKAMAARVTITETKNVQIVLSNWASSDQASRWQLDTLRLVRVGG